MYRLKLGDDVSAAGGRDVVGYGAYIVLGQEVERAENLVVVELEALGRLQTAQVVRVHGCLGHLLGAPLCFVPSLRILRGDARAPPAAAGVVVVRVRRHVGVVVLCAV